MNNNVTVICQMCKMFANKFIISTSKVDDMSMLCSQLVLAAPKWQQNLLLQVTNFGVDNRFILLYTVCEIYCTLMRVAQYDMLSVEMVSKKKTNIALYVKH